MKSNIDHRRKKRRWGQSRQSHRVNGPLFKQDVSWQWPISLMIHQDNLPILSATQQTITTILLTLITPRRVLGLALAMLRAKPLKKSKNNLVTRVTFSRLSSNLLRSIRLKKLRELLDNELKSKVMLQQELDQVKRDLSTLKQTKENEDKKQKELERTRLQSMPVPYKNTPQT